MTGGQEADMELTDPVERQIQSELNVAAASDVLRVAEDIRQRMGPSVAAVIFYGSCLRTGELADKVLDFYVLVDNYIDAYGMGWKALANSAVPPNVFYLETPGGNFTLRTKYAVLSIADFKYGCGISFNSSIWARFAQPCQLVWCRDDMVQSVVVLGLSDAVTTIVSETVPLMPDAFTAGGLWSRAFSETYKVELRSEKDGKGRSIYEEYADRYNDLTLAALERGGMSAILCDNEMKLSAPLPGGARWRTRLAWIFRRMQGKSLSLIRLIKASTTFDGGIDYLAWKISRHSGVEITVSPWQRRHPVIAGLLMFWRLRRKGAFR